MRIHGLALDKEIRTVNNEVIAIYSSFTVCMKHAYNENTDNRINRHGY